MDRPALEVWLRRARGGGISIRVVVRDIWWEGLDGDERKALAARDVPLADDARLLEVVPESGPVDLWVWLAFVGSAAFLFGALFTLCSFPCT